MSYKSEVLTYPEAIQYMFDRLPMFHRIGVKAYKRICPEHWQCVKDLEIRKQNYSAYTSQERMAKDLYHICWLRRCNNMDIL